MRSPALAIAWEFRQRHRAALLALASYALVFGAARLLWPGPGEPLRLDPPNGIAGAVIAPFSTAFMYCLAVFSFGLGGDMAARQSPFPTRMFTLPVTTRALAGWPMLSGTAAVASLWLATWLRRWIPLGLFLGELGGPGLPVYVLAWMVWTVTFRRLGAYDLNRNWSTAGEVQTIVVAIATSTVLLAGALYLTYRGLSRLLFGYFMAFDTVLTLLLRRAADGVGFEGGKDDLRFATPAVAVTEIENLAAALATMGGQDTYRQVGDLRRIVRRLDEKNWLDNGRICIALARAFAEALLFEEAKDYYPSPREGPGFHDAEGPGAVRQPDQPGGRGCLEARRGSDGTRAAGRDRQGDRSP